MRVRQASEKRLSTWAQAHKSSPLPRNPILICRRDTISFKKKKKKGAESQRKKETVGHYWVE